MYKEKKRSSWTRMDPTPMTSAVIMRGRFGATGTWGEHSHVKMGAETGVHCHQQRMPRSTRSWKGQGRTRPTIFAGGIALPNLDCRLLASSTEGECISGFYKALRLWNLAMAAHHFLG